MRKPREIINQLSPQDALAVLKALADSDANLARRIAEIATEHLSEVDPQDVAEEVYYALESLQVENVWDRSGSTSQMAETPAATEGAANNQALRTS